jgi:hypothetical protein
MGTLYWNDESAIPIHVVRDANFERNTLYKRTARGPDDRKMNSLKKAREQERKDEKAREWKESHPKCKGRPYQERCGVWRPADRCEEICLHVGPFAQGAQRDGDNDMSLSNCFHLA